MVTYCFYALFAGLGIMNLCQGRPWVALFYAVLLGVMFWFDRKMARDTAAHEARMKLAADKHKELMAHLEEETERARKNTEELIEGLRAKRQAYLDAHYFCQVVLVRAECQPMTPETADRIREEFRLCGEQVISNLS